MCGIVGLFLKNEALAPELGGMLAQMLGVMSHRGPDSAGFAVYTDEEPGRIKLTLRMADPDVDPAVITAGLDVETKLTIRDSHLVLSLPEADEAKFLVRLEKDHPDVGMVGRGRRMEIYKEVGPPSSVAGRFDLAAMSGTHGVGHTRMATESSVSTKGAHPFSTGRDQCLVHNGSLSNHNAVRRQLQHEGLTFETENDSEVAAGYLTWRLRQGATLEEALQASLADLDGFFTFVVGTESGFAVLRDPIACKPAVMAETDDYVAFGSEYRALAVLPGVASARVFEPEPATVYAWTRQG